LIQRRGLGVGKIGKINAPTKLWAFDNQKNNGGTPLTKIPDPPLKSKRSCKSKIFCKLKRI
jgi:hypothetical protein